MGSFYIHAEIVSSSVKKYQCILNIFLVLSFCITNINDSLWLLEQQDWMYIHNIIGHYNPSVNIIDLVSHTTYVMCVNFIHKWRYLQFKVDSERQIFWETFHGNFFWQKSADRISPKKYFSYFILMSGLGLEPWLFV